LEEAAREAARIENFGKWVFGSVVIVILLFVI
jgi:hypothetical protein